MLALFKANLKEAASSLVVSRQRSLLALIGIAIGVGSVTAMISVGVVVQTEALKRFQELGTDILSIDFVTNSPRPGMSKVVVTPDDAAGLVTLPTIAAAAPYARSSGAASAGGETIRNVSVIGATAALADLNKLEIEAGRFISDLDHRRRFCVVGARVAARMRDAGIRRLVGEAVRIDDAIYTVVGVLRPTLGGLRTFDANRSVVIPISTAQRVFSRPDIRNVTARTAAGAHHLAATAEVGDYFRRKLPRLQVRVRSAERLIQQMHEQMRLFTLLLGSVGGISLLVGGIGVMNVMLASVAERRLEIGIRRALGARRTDIQSQFVIESVILSLVGGVVGIGMGIGATYAICSFTGWAFQVSMAAMGLGMGVAGGSGVFFGFFPAYQAARLDPVAALRGT